MHGYSVLAHPNTTSLQGISVYYWPGTMHALERLGCLGATWWSSLRTTKTTSPGGSKLSPVDNASCLNINFDEL